MDHPWSASANGDDNVGIPDDLRCKRSDGKQWRCTAMSMPDKTVCEKHYIQAKKRAANSALRASLKKAKRKSLGESDIFLESKSDDVDVPLANMKVASDYPSASGKKYLEKVSKSHFRYSPETPSTTRGLSARNSSKVNDDSERDVTELEEDVKFYKMTPSAAMDSSKSKSQRSVDANNPMIEYTDGSMDSSEDTGGQSCHHCRRNSKDRVIWCLKCDKRGYCNSCISTWYSDIPLEEIEKVCPACRGSCICKACLRADNMIKSRIREIPVLEKLQYLYWLLSAVLPIVKQIHQIQCSEVELEKRLRGNEIDVVRAKLNADEQMCCNSCRIPIIDYHRHCANCSYDLCLSCCEDLRGTSAGSLKSNLIQNYSNGRSQDSGSFLEPAKTPNLRLNLSDKFPGWEASDDGSIPCPPKEYGGCGYKSLNLSRIFKMNWVAKLVKNVEEMVSGCKIHNSGTLKTEYDDSRLREYAHREDGDDNSLYCPSYQDSKCEGISNFRNRWVKGEPVIIRDVFDSSSMSIWDPKVIWREIRGTADEKSKDENRTVKAIDCLDGSEVDIELSQFIEGYSEGGMREDGSPEILKLKDWPSPSSCEEYLLYHKPEFTSKLPLLEYIHSKLGFLNVAAKLPHYSLQNNVGPKIYMSYGTPEELGTGDSVTNLHLNTHDMVYLLVHVCELKHQKTEVNESSGNEMEGLDERRLSDVPLENDYKSGDGAKSNTTFEDEVMDDQGIQTMIVYDKAVGLEQMKRDLSEKLNPGAVWDVFRRQDVPKLIEYLKKHWQDFGNPDSVVNDVGKCPLYDELVYLNGNHKRKLKEEFGVEPWSFEQHLGQAVFVPAGCPFQVRNLRSTVELGLDFLFPESVGEALRLAEEIRCLPNEHEAKLQVLEVGKISLYAASSAIKEVQKLVLDPRLAAELGFEDPNLTAQVSENLDNLMKHKQIPCA